jgi:AcrR family transcriptional regulator
MLSLSTLKMPKLKSPAKPKKSVASYHHGDLRNALIAAGLDILAKDGAHALTLREVARRARVSHAAPYRHFESKEALLAAIAEEGFNEFAARLRAVAQNNIGDSRMQLYEATQAYVGFAKDRPDHFRVMFSNLITDRDAYPSLIESGLTAFNLLADIMNAGQKNGAIIDGDSRHLALVGWAAVHGFSMLLIEDQIKYCIKDADIQHLMTLLAITFYRGVEAA